MFTVPEKVRVYVERALKSKDGRILSFVGEDQSELSNMINVISANIDAVQLQNCCALDFLKGVLSLSNSERDTVWLRRDMPKLSDVLTFALENGRDLNNEIKDFSGFVTRVTDEMPLNCEESALICQKDWGLVALDGSFPATEAILNHVRDANAILFDRRSTGFGGARAFAKLFEDTNYIFVDVDSASGITLFVKRSIVSELSVHFFTIVLNGCPFIKYHEDVLTKLPFPWHWHIVEGVADLVKDTAWSVATGGTIPDQLHDRGRSNDGTSEYLDDLKQRLPDNVTIYRKLEGQFWNGKVEMVGAPLRNITEACLLWQVDADELWTSKQIEVMRQQFLEHPSKTSAYFWCRYYVGPTKGISTRYNYAQNPHQEWLRVWKYVPGMHWERHEPPQLFGVDHDTGSFYDVAARNPFTHYETESAGLIFDHFAYATIEQVRFKEIYYGYAGALESWSNLQRVATAGECSSRHLKDYFQWVTDDTMVDDIERLGWRPLARVDTDSGEWVFGERSKDPCDPAIGKSRTILVDGVFYQLNNSGIARVWTNLLKAWVASGFAENLILLDRGGTAPRIDGIRYCSIKRHSIEDVSRDADYLQKVCDELGAGLFISTYYTLPTRTPSVFFGHDMIPEIMGADLEDPWWQQKSRAIEFAVAHIMVSKNSADDLVRFHPRLKRSDILVAPNSVDDTLVRPSDEQVDRFRNRYSLDRDFILMVGERDGWLNYKNGLVVYSALSTMRPDLRPLLLCVGGKPFIGELGEALLQQSDVKLLKLGDEELAAAYACARALICPSLYEGFGLPVLEALSIGCPVIACHNSSIPEVTNGAAFYFDPMDPIGLAEIIKGLSDESTRNEVISRGLEWAKAYSQTKTAAEVENFLAKILDGLPLGTPSVYFGSIAEHYLSLEALKKERSANCDLRKSFFDLQLELSKLDHVQPLSSLDFEDPDDGIRKTLNANFNFADRVSRLLVDAISRHQLEVLESGPGLHCRIVSGLEDEEGPLYDLGIRDKFRWQSSARLELKISTQQAQSAFLRLRISNFASGQELSIRAGDVEIARVPIAVTNWSNFLSLSVPIDLGVGENSVTIVASSYDSFSQIRLYLAYLDIHVAPD